MLFTTNTTKSAFYYTAAAKTTSRDSSCFRIPLSWFTLV